MKNILNEKPSHDLHGRLLYSVQFVKDEDMKNKNVLDVGCGYGWFELNALNRNVGKITGFEASENDLKTARENIINNNVEFSTYKDHEERNILYLPYADNEFDTVVSWEVLEHIPAGKETQFFKEIFRILRKNNGGGGVFYLSTPNRHFFSNFFDPAWILTGHRHYKIKDLIKFGENAGFSVECFFIKGGWWEIISINLLYICKWIFRKPLFFKNYFNKKLDIEYNKDNGFTGIFIKFKKGF